MDGKLMHSMEVQTKPSGLVYFDPFSEEQMTLFLPEGDHVFRAAFVNDDFVKGLSEKDAYNNKTNKFLESITFEGPFPSKVEKASRKKILICDPNSSAACVRLSTVSSVSLKYCRRSLCPTMAWVAPTALIMGPETSPVKAPSLLQERFWPEMAICVPLAASAAAEMAVKGGAITMSQCLEFATSGVNAEKNARVSAIVLNIFQLPAITRRRMPVPPKTNRTGRNACPT
jgi:hypothetical protein